MNLKDAHVKKYNTSSEWFYYISNNQDLLTTQCNAKDYLLKTTVHIALT